MSSNNDLISNIDGNIECTISQIEVLNTNSRLKESELHSLEHLKNENDMLKEEIRRLQDENKKIMESDKRPAVASNIIKEFLVLPKAFFKLLSWSALLSLHPSFPRIKFTFINFVVLLEPKMKDSPFVSYIK